MKGFAFLPRVVGLLLCLAATGVSAERRSFAGLPTTGWTKPAAIGSTRAKNAQISVATKDVATAMPRGGACADTTPALLAKLGIKAAAEALVLWGILLGGPAITAKQPSEFMVKVFGESIFDLLCSMVVVFGSSGVGALVDGGLSAATAQALRPTEVAGDPEWYASLEKPPWTPPGVVFPIMWLLVSKPTQLCALSRIFKFAYREDTPASKLALAVYAGHLALGDAWNKIFFGLECIGLGTVTITLFFGALLASAYLFYSLERGAGYYMLPTCGWVAVATSLQYSIYFRNKNNKK